MNGKTRTIVIPGEELGSTKDMISGHGVYEEGDKILSKFVGIPKRSEKYMTVIPLSGVYVPRVKDNIVGVITDVEKVGWIVDINSPWQAFLSLSEGVNEFVDTRRVSLTRYFDVGDVIYTTISDDKRGDAQLTMKSMVARKLKGGVIVKITPTKVPRLIGKEGSMVNLIKEKTGTIIRVGQNGVIWLSGENVEKAIKAVRMIEEKSHVFGLTDEVLKFLSD